MRSLFDFVVTPKGSRNSSKKNLDGKELILNTDLQDHKYVNRVGTIIGAPLGDCGGVSTGDDVIVHHNVFIWSLDKEKQNIGVIKILGDDLVSLDLQQGDIVGFTPRSEYEFVIDGERLYRVLSAAITINYGHERNEKEYNPSWS